MAVEKEELYQLIKILPEDEVSKVKVYLENLIKQRQMENIKKAQTIIRGHIPAGRSLSQELVEERRREAQNE